MGHKAKPGRTAKTGKDEGPCNPAEVKLDRRAQWRRTATNFMACIVPQVEIPGGGFGDLRRPALRTKELHNMMAPLAEAVNIPFVEFTRLLSRAYVVRRDELGEALWGSSYRDRTRREDRNREEVGPRNDVKPCPRCGSKPTLELASKNKHWGYQMRCKNCGERTARYHTRRETLTMWRVKIKTGEAV